MPLPPAGNGVVGHPVIVPTTRGLVAGALIVGLALAGWCFGVEELVLLACGFSLVTVAGGLVLWGRVRRSKSHLRVEPHPGSAEVPVGAEIAATVRVVHGGRRPARPTWLEDPAGGWRRLPPRTPPVRSEWAASRGEPSHSRMSEWSWARRRPDRGGGDRWRPSARLLPVPGLLPGERITFSSPVPTAARGVMALAGSRLWEEDPFRLFAHCLAVGPSRTIVVCPVPAESSVPLPVNRNSESGSFEAAAHQAGHEDEQFAVLAVDGEQMTLRPYSPGDRLHRLFWPALARSGELLIRDTEGARSQTGRVSLLMDVRASVHDPASLDRVVELAAGVGVLALERELRVDLVTTAGEVLAVDPGGDGRRELLRWLAAVGPARVSATTPLAPVAGSPPRQSGPGARVVVTTPAAADTLPPGMRGGAVVTW